MTFIFERIVYSILRYLRFFRSHCPSSRHRIDSDVSSVKYFVHLQIEAIRQLVYFQVMLQKSVNCQADSLRAT